MRVAVVHEWLATWGGSERVTQEILDLYPNADVFVLVDFLPQSYRGFLEGRKITTSFIQSLPFARKRFRAYLPLMPLAVEQFDLTEYDLVISSSHAVSKGVLTKPYQLHVSYVHTPMRYAWDLQNSYLRGSGMPAQVKSLLARPLLHYMRLWDARTSNGVDCFIANSEMVARRIMKTYGRNSIVVNPPVDIDLFPLNTNKENFYVTASRLVAYKRVDLLIDAFAAMPHQQLVVIGDGPEMQRLKTKATANIKFLGYQPRALLVDHLQRAKAFVFAGEEDFGIAAVEAQACGTPVIGYAHGGTGETVIDGETGVLFMQQSAEAVASAIKRFEARAPFEAGRLRRNAERFTVPRFRHEFSRVVEEALTQLEVNPLTRNKTLRSVSRPVQKIQRA